jgi:hypothetical protein
MIVVQLAQTFVGIMLNASRSVRISVRVRCRLKDQRRRLLLISVKDVDQGAKRTFNA